VAGTFTRLVVYRLAAELADELHARAVAFPRLDRWSLGIQLIRAADSVGANIGESAGTLARTGQTTAPHDRPEARGLLERGTNTRTNELGRALNGLIKRPN
jgi:23S rRNA-intervening sequence protein